MDTDFEGECDVGIKAKVVGKAFAVAFGQRLVPIEGVTGFLDDSGQACGVLGGVGFEVGGDLAGWAEKFESIGDGIDASFVGEFIDEAVDGVGMEDIADAAEPADVKGGFGASCFAKDVGDAVGHIECAHAHLEDHRAIIARPEGVDECGVDSAVVPRKRHTLFVKGGAEGLEAFGVVKAVFDLVFASPLEADREADLLGEQDGFEDKVGLRLASKAPAEKGDVEGDLVFGEAELLGDGFFGADRILARSPDLAGSVFFDVRSAHKRLHRGMNQIGRVVSAFDLAFALCFDATGVSFAAVDDISLFESLFEFFSVGGAVVKFETLGVPLDLEGALALDGGPCVGGDDTDRSVGVDGGRESVDGLDAKDTFDLFGCGVIERLDLGPRDRSACRTSVHKTG